jgi:hypothetical protein
MGQTGQVPPETGSKIKACLSACNQGLGACTGYLPAWGASYQDCLERCVDEAGWGGPKRKRSVGRMGPGSPETGSKLDGMPQQSK